MLLDEYGKESFVARHGLDGSLGGDGCFLCIVRPLSSGDMENFDFYSARRQEFPCPRKNGPTQWFGVPGLLLCEREGN